MDIKKKIWEILAVYNDYTNQTHCSDWHKTILIYDDEEFDIFEEDVETVKEIIKELEILEAIRNDFKLLDWGEDFQNRYELVYHDRYKRFINKIEYDKWSRWLENDK